MSYTYEYPRPAVTTDTILIFRTNNLSYILLIERKYDPFCEYWALPGGFVEMDEDLETACARELKEETGISGIKLTQFHTFGEVNRDPRGRTISVVYWSVIDQIIEPEGGDDAAQAKWFPLNNLPLLAFDHKKIIGKFLKRNII